MTRLGTAKFLAARAQDEVFRKLLRATFIILGVGRIVNEDRIRS